jgi:hypothetical protein
MLVETPGGGLPVEAWGPARVQEVVAGAVHQVTGGLECWKGLYHPGRPNNMVVLGGWFHPALLEIARPLSAGNARRSEGPFPN